MNKFLVTVLSLVIFYSGASAYKLEKVFSFNEVGLSFHSDSAEFLSSYYMGRIGAPRLPLKRVSLLLPAKTDLSTVTVFSKYSDFKEVGTNVRIASVAVDVDGDLISPCDTAIYGINSFFPSDVIVKVKTSRYRQFNIVDIYLSPFKYNPVTGELLRTNGVEINVEFNEKPIRQYFGASSNVVNILKNRVENFDELYSSYCISRSGVREKVYIIATTEKAVNGLSNLDDFVALKRAQGYKTEIVTEGTWGGGSGDNAADNLRDWLVKNYLSMNINYLLVIGDPSPADGDIAMKVAYAYYGGKTAPTDFYFGELSGNWDADGDGKYGEVDDVNASGGIDCDADVAVGRISLYGNDFGSVDTVLSKTITYETEDPNDISWRNNMLLVMDGYYACEGPELGEKIKNDVFTANSDWGFYRIYCNNLLAPEEAIITETAVTNAWNGATYGVVSWLTHGKEDAALHVMNTSYAQSLSNLHPSIAMMGSCLNGAPDYPKNLANTLLKHGAIATISGSVTTIFKQPMGDFVGSSYNHGFVHGFTTNVSINRSCVADALDKTKRDSDLDCWKNYCAFNLYGDPTVNLDASSETVGITEHIAVGNRYKLGISGNLLKLEASNSVCGVILTIYSVSGRKFFERSFDKLASDGYSLNLAKMGFPSGIYICSLKGSGINARKNFVIHK